MNEKVDLTELHNKQVSEMAECLLSTNMSNESTGIIYMQYKAMFAEETSVENRFWDLASSLIIPALVLANQAISKIKKENKNNPVKADVPEILWTRIHSFLIGDDEYPFNIHGGIVNSYTLSYAIDFFRKLNPAYSSYSEILKQQNEPYHTWECKGTDCTMPTQFMSYGEVMYFKKNKLIHPKWCKYCKEARKKSTSGAEQQ